MSNLLNHPVVWCVCVCSVESLYCSIIFGDQFSDPGYVSSSLRSQSSEHGGGSGGVGGVMARVLPRKKKTTVADPQDAWSILKDRQMYR